MSEYEVESDAGSDSDSDKEEPETNKLSYVTGDSLQQPQDSFTYVNSYVWNAFGKVL